MRIGAHVDAGRSGRRRGRAAAPRSCSSSSPTRRATPRPKPRADAEALRAAPVDIYIHSPYRLNVATTNNRIRIPSRKLLQQHAQAAAEIGAKGLIVHGGHVDRGGELDAGFDELAQDLRYAAESGGFPLPILIENTAGGDNACARRFDALARLWDAIGEFGAGFCLDTCHAHAGGEELLGIVDRVKAITGRIDLIHANDSRDAFDSGADRHDNIGHGQIDPDLIIAVIRAAGAPAVVETPADGQAADIALLRAGLTA